MQELERGLLTRPSLPPLVEDLHPRDGPSLITVAPQSPPVSVAGHHPTGEQMISGLPVVFALPQPLRITHYDSDPSTAHASRSVLDVSPRAAVRHLGSYRTLTAHSTLRSTQIASSSTSTYQNPPAASPDTNFNGPMKVLQDLGADDASDVENHDPIIRQVFTRGEASVAFKLCVMWQLHSTADVLAELLFLSSRFFSKCLPNAPFLDAAHDSDVDQVRARNVALFLNIIVVAARFWSQSSR